MGERERDVNKYSASQRGLGLGLISSEVFNRM